MNKNHLLPRILVSFLLAALAAWATPVSAEVSKRSLLETEAKVQAVVARAMPCTVGLTSLRTGATGSGVIVSSEGLILTAGHVTQAAGDDLIVFLPDGRRVKGRALGANYGRDASMVRIVEQQGPFPFVEIGDSDSLQLDQWCLALGHAAGFQRDRTAPIRLGRILGRNLVGFVSTDCTLIGGDSGGPLFDLDGKLIGIHSNIGTTLSENHHVPIAVFKQDWDRMLEGDRWGRLLGAKIPGNPKRPMLGVTPNKVVDGGVQVDVIPGGSAARAGLQDGDVIKSLGGKATPDQQALLKAINSHRIGQKVKVVVARENQELTIEVRLRRASGGHPPMLPGSDDPSSDEASEGETATDVETGEDSSGEDAEPATEQARQDLLKQLVEEAQREKRRLELTPEQLDELGGPGKFLERMRKVGEDLAPQDLARLMGIRMGEDTFFEEIIAAYRPVVAPASRSVHRVMKGDRQVALGTVVHRDGYLLTKASEVKGQEITIDVNGKRLPATLDREFPEYDLALMKIDTKLVPIAWSDRKRRPTLASFVSAVGIDDIALAVGLISVEERSLSAKDKPFLGVGLELVTGGLRISNVLSGGAAAKAGLKRNDIITAMDGKQYEDVQQFIDDLQTRKPGDKIALDLVRGEDRMRVEAKLGDRSLLPEQGPRLNMYPQGGRLSENRSGYPSVLQTDLPIEPQECGSPVIGLDGCAMGINIARAGRIKTYAIPARTIRALLQNAFADHKTSSADRPSDIALAIADRG